jgi:hypothetical protein
MAMPCHSMPFWPPRETKWRTDDFKYDDTMISDDEVLQYLYSFELMVDEYNIAGAVACICIVIPMFLDTLIDSLPPWVLNVVYTDERPQFKPVSDEILRFTHLERLIFIAGIALNPIGLLYVNMNLPPGDPMDNPLAYRYAQHIEQSTQTVGIVCVLAPVFMLMARLSKVWSPLYAWLVLFCTAWPIFQDAPIPCPSVATYRRYQAMNSITTWGSTILFILGCLACIAKYYKDSHANKHHVTSQAAMEKKLSLVEKKLRVLIY